MHSSHVRRSLLDANVGRVVPPARLPELLARRSALQVVGGAGLAAMLAPGLSLLRADRANAAQEALSQPSELRSRDGALDVVLTAAPGMLRLGDVQVPGFLYNEAYIPPLIRLRLGDVLRVRFKNNIPDGFSNLHFHGLSVSPRGRSDNVFVQVSPGHEFEYEVKIPEAGRQGPGLFWYHPHGHGFVTKQMLGGLSGALVVDGSETLFPILKDLPERFLLIKHVEPGGGREVVSINGQMNPVVEIRPGEIQLWRIANIGATLFSPFLIDGVSLYAISIDGHPLSRPRKFSEFFLGPGQRIDAIAIGPPAGEYAMGTLLFKNMAWREPFPAQQIATVVSAGPPVPGDAEAQVTRQRVARPRWIDEVRASPIARMRRLVYSRTDDRSVFMIDGRVLDDNRVDQTVKLGDTEEWTIVNTDQQYHSFHIHQTPFLVAEVDGMPQDEDSLRDTMPISPATAERPGEIKVIIPFTDPEIVGRFVYHCHAVDHEDKGMMGTVLVAI
jgi:suppressor of ftsI